MDVKTPEEIVNGEQAALEIRSKSHSDRYQYYMKLQKATRVTRVLSLLEKEKGERNIVGELGLESDEWEELRREALSDEGRRLKSRSKEEIFAQYVIAQSGCIKDLVEMGKNLGKNKKDNAALVNSVKVRSEIFDRIIQMGQELGLIEKREVVGKGTEVNVGVVLSGLSDGELKSKVVAELSNLNSIVSEFGDGELLQLKPGRLHHRLKGKRKNVNSNKVHGGAGVDRRK